MDELAVFPNDESLPSLISQQTPLNTDKEDCKPADSLQLTVDNWHSNQNTDCISLEKGGDTIRENAEVELELFVDLCQLFVDL